MNKKIIKKISIGLITVALGILTIGCSQQQKNDTTPTTSTKIATIDYQLAIQKHPKIKEAQETMKKTYDEMQNQLSSMASLSPEEQQAKANNFQKDMQAKEKEVFEPIKKDIDNNVNTVMKEKGYSVVADKRAIIAGGEDITIDVLIKEGLDETTAKQAVSETENMF